MSSDYEFDDLDEATIALLDAAEKNATVPPAAVVVQPQQPASPTFSDLDSFIISAEDLQRIDSQTAHLLQQSTPQTSNQPRPWGGIADNSTASSSRGPAPPPPAHRLGRQSARTKVWDHSQFAKSGSKAQRKPDAEAGDEEEAPEFEQFPRAPTRTFSFFGSMPTENSLVVLRIRPLPPQKHQIDLLNAKHWHYPLNQPKRDYQFNIVQHAFTDNTLVALPTGLGKTFIAGVIMLNYYRWFPGGKIVFMAPTRPLVAQQIEACHQTCGIPGRDAAEMTGNTVTAKRIDMWENKRVFYCTPQTFQNDLIHERVDARDIVLIVVDEAHKASGNYAYAQVVRIMKSRNSHFRILALTATPGANKDAVQAIVDSLHISHIEIRNEESMDIQKYIQKKEIKQTIVRMDEPVLKIQGLLKSVMEDTMESAIKCGLIYPQNPIKLHPYTINQAQMKAKASKRGYMMKGLSTLATWARAMAYLMEATTAMCERCVKDAVGLTGDSGATDVPEYRAAGQNKLQSDPKVKALLQGFEDLKLEDGSFPVHPKIEILKRILIQHFGQAMPDEPTEGGEVSSTRAMVFVTNRGCVDELEKVLNCESPLIRPRKFVGQSADTQGRKGLTQKEQLEIIQKFKKGEFNVLIATSVGEEGLDIGEVDLIVCYDAQKTPIRMLQRAGRAGRKRQGFVHVLLSEIREEANWDKAKNNYKDVQNSIVMGRDLELYCDVERLLPERIKPICLEKVMVIEPYVREEARTTSVDAEGSQPSRKGKGKGIKRKRQTDVPEEASTGFVSVRELIAKKPKLTAQARKWDPSLMESDDEDRDIDAGPSALLSRRQTAPEPSKKPSQTPVLRKAKTTPVAREESRSEDEEIASPGGKGKGKEREVIELLSSPAMSVKSMSPASVQSPPAPNNSNVAWLVGDDESDEDGIMIIESSPIVQRDRSCDIAASPTRAKTKSPSVEVSSPPTPARILSSPKRSSPVIKAVSSTMTSESSQAIVRRRPRAVVANGEDSSPLKGETTHRFRRGKESRKKLKMKDNPWADGEAAHSGDDVSAGEATNSDDDVANTSDNEFAGNFAPTQASPSYQQTQAYRESLLTQIPADKRTGPIFASRARRRDGGANFGPQRDRPRVSSSPQRATDEEPDEYNMGSFVVDNDAEIEYEE